MTLKKTIFASLCAIALQAYAEISVKVNLPSYTLKVYDSNIELASFPVRVGDPKTPTPIGKGQITERRKEITFRYLDGENEGEKITRSRINPTGEFIDMPYDKMRGLKLVIGNRDEGKVIHSTTDYWTIGLPKSHGCVGLSIDDMLRLFDIVKNVPTPVEIEYETVDVQDGEISFYADIYDRQTNVLQTLVSKGVKIGDFNSAQNRANLIDQQLRYNLRIVLRKTRAGKDASKMRDLLCYRISVDDFLKPCYPEQTVVNAEVLDNDCFADPLLRAGFSNKTVSYLTEALDLDYRKLHPGDAFTVFVKGKEIVGFDYKGKQGNRSFDLHRRNIFVE